jgi:hypothetical protein
MYIYITYIYTYYIYIYTYYIYIYYIIYYILYIIYVIFEVQFSVITPYWSILLVFNGCFNALQSSSISKFVFRVLTGYSTFPGKKKLLVTSLIHLLIISGWCKFTMPCCNHPGMNPVDDKKWSLKPPAGK